MKRSDARTKQSDVMTKSTDYGKKTGDCGKKQKGDSDQIHLLDVCAWCTSTLG
jgi:hypothetical protein